MNPVAQPLAASVTPEEQLRPHLVASVLADIEQMPTVRVPRGRENDPQPLALIGHESLPALRAKLETLNLSELGRLKKLLISRHPRASEMDPRHKALRDPSSGLEQSMARESQIRKIMQLLWGDPFLERHREQESVFDSLVSRMQPDVIISVGDDPYKDLGSAKAAQREHSLREARIGPERALRYINEGSPPGLRRYDSSYIVRPRFNRVQSLLEYVRDMRGDVQRSIEYVTPVHEAIRRELQGIRERICTGTYSPADFRSDYARWAEIPRFGSSPDTGPDAMVEDLLTLPDVPRLLSENPSPTAEIAVGDYSRPTIKDGIVYLPSRTEAVLRMVDHVDLSKGRTFVEMGCGLGKVSMLVALLSGANTLGVDYQKPLADAAGACAKRMGLHQCDFVHGDAREVDISKGDVFYFYQPFTGEVLKSVLERLHGLARQKQFTVVWTGPDYEALACQPWLRKAKDSPVALSPLCEYDPGRDSDFLHILHSAPPDEIRKNAAKMGMRPFPKALLEAWKEVEEMNAQLESRT